MRISNGDLTEMAFDYGAEKLTKSAYVCLVLDLVDARAEIAQLKADTRQLIECIEDINK